MLEPQVFFSWNSVSESAVFQPSIQLGYLFTPSLKASPYVAAHGGGFFSEGQNSGIIGGSVGLHVKAADGLGLRFEGRYRRWLCEFCEWQDLSLLIGVGGVIR